MKFTFILFLSAVILLPLFFSKTPPAFCKEERGFTDIDNFEKNNSYDLDIYLDVTGADTGKVAVLIAVQKKNIFSFEQKGMDGEFQFSNIRFYDGGKNELSYNRKGYYYYLDKKDYDTILIQYDVMPGGKGRHGHQGYVSEKFASFDGRVLIFPENFSDIKKVRIQYKVPEGWEIINPFRKKDNEYYPDYFGSSFIYETLLKSSMTFGPFEEKTKIIGNTPLSVYSYSEWPSDHKEAITKKAFSIYEYFFEKFGFNPSVPYIICWTPPSSEGEKVYTGSWTNGQTYEMGEDKLRNWELMAHRLTHALNRDKPTGSYLEDNSDLWIIEAWPSYMEIIVTSSLRIAEDERRWNRIYEEYYVDKILNEHPEWNYPVSKEYMLSGRGRELLHYFKEPLILKMLDFEMRVKTGKNIEEFMAFAYDKYGYFKGPFPFKKELEAFTGTSFEDFWNVMVRDRGYAIPVWEEYITPEIEENMKRPCAFTVSSEKIPGDYLFYLANSQSFESYSHIIKFVSQEIKRRETMSSENIVFYPDVIREHIYGFTPQVRLLITDYEKARFAGNITEEYEDIQFNSESPSGKIFKKLLEIEKDYEKKKGKCGIYSVNTVNTEDEIKLSFYSDDKIIARVKWIDSGFDAEYELISPEGEIYESKSFFVSPQWADEDGFVSANVIFNKKRPENEGVWLVRVKKGKEPLIEIPLWQCRYETE